MKPPLFFTKNEFSEEDLSKFLSDIKYNRVSMDVYSEKDHKQYSPYYNEDVRKVTRNGFRNFITDNH